MITKPGAILLAVLAVAAAPSQSRDANADLVVVHPADPGSALDNPGMGWVFHYYDNSIQRYGSRLAPFSRSTTTLRVLKPAINRSRTRAACARPAIPPA